MLQMTRSFAVVGAVVLAGSLAACGHNRSAPAPQYSGGYSGGYQTAPAYPQNPAGTEYGRVSNIEVLQGGRSQGQTSGAGAVLGAVVGGVLGGKLARFIKPQVLRAVVVTIAVIVAVIYLVR